MRGMLFLLSCCMAFSVSEASNNSATEEEVEHFTMAHFDFDRVKTPLSIAIWLFLVALARLGFHQNERLPAMFPESCLLIILGVLAGLVVYFVGGTSIPLYPDTFFLFLLPPIILEAGFFMNMRALFDNVGTVAWYAVVGTIFNTVTIGFSLYAFSASVLGWMQIPMTMLDAMLFASLIAAVDPVAVLAVFQEIHVNEELYILVFGESLFNDAVSVVLFNMFYKLSYLRQHGEIWASDWVQACLSLFVVGVVGAAIGILFAFTTAFITKFTRPLRVLEPLFAFLMAYMAYICAELFHFSGILAAVFCGMFMKPYIRSNMSTKSYTTVKYFLKMLSSVSESIVFMLMGLATVDRKHQIDYAFIGLSILFCLIYRILGVIVLTWIINRFRTVKLGRVDQFVMAYGGLRGAIAMSLALLITRETSSINDYLVTCTIAIVYFTVFVQGITIRPLVNWLKVKKQGTSDPSTNALLHLRVMDYVMAAVEDLAGIRGHNLLRTKIERVIVKYLEPILLRDAVQTRESGMLHVISKLNMKEAAEFVNVHGSMQAYARRLDPADPYASSSAVARANSGGFATRASSNSLRAGSKWRRVIVAVRLAAYAGRMRRRRLSDADTHKMLKENLFKEPQYYRAQFLSSRLRLNESFVSAKQLAAIRNKQTSRNQPARARGRLGRDANGMAAMHSESDLMQACSSHDYDTPAASLHSLPTVTSRRSPSHVFSTTGSSAISIRVAPPSLLSASPSMELVHGGSTSAQAAARAAFRPEAIYVNMSALNHPRNTRESAL